MDPLRRRRTLIRMGVADAIPDVRTRRLWCFIDDRAPPEGDADGQFDTHESWVNHASSWIGWTGAKSFDARNRPCRIGADMQRARDEGTFPVRFYMPDRFPRPQPMPERMFNLLAGLRAAGPAGIAVGSLPDAMGLRTMRSIPVETCIRLGYAETTGDRLGITPKGGTDLCEETRRRRLAATVSAA